MPVQGVGNGDRPVLSPGTPDGNDQLVLPLQNIVGHEKIHHVAKLCQKRLRRSPLHHIILDVLFLPGSGPKLFHIEGIWQKPDVKHQIRVRRDPVLKPKRQNRHKQVAIAFILYEDLLQLLP